MTNTDNDIIRKTLDLLPLFNTAIKNFRLYPPTSAIVKGAIEKFYIALSDLLVAEEIIFFTESEKSLLICGKSLMQKDQEKFLTQALLNVLLGLGIRSISFRRGLEKDELERFLELLARNPESIEKEGGIAKWMSDLKIIHAEVDQKVYVALDKGQQALANIETAGDQLARFFMLGQPGMEPGSEQLSALAKNPEAMTKAFTAGLSKILSQGETLTDGQLASNLDNLLSLLDNVADGLDDENSDGLSRQIVQSLMATDPVLAEQLTSRNIQHLLGGHFYRYLTTEVGQYKLDSAQTAVTEAEASKNKLLEVAEKFAFRLQDARTVLDAGLMAYLPKIIEQLVAQKQQEAVERVLERLAANLQSENPEVRLRAARSLGSILERLPREQQRIIVEKIFEDIGAWLKAETVFTPEYEKICIIWKNIAQDLIVQNQFSGVIRYLDALHEVTESTRETTGTAGQLALKLIAELSSPQYIDILIAEINQPESALYEDANRLLAALGANAVLDLLEQLHIQTESNERVKTMRLLASLNEKALPHILDKIAKPGPWFYLRNLAYLLGQIGREENADALVPLLDHDNDKVRLEAIRSIYKIGGNQRGRLLLGALPGADDDFKAGIVEMLGQSRATDAVPALIEMLKNRPLITTAARSNLEEKICTALGLIGSPEAIAPLSEITSTKFLTLRTYPDKVKAAAAHSLVTLKRKAAQT